MTPLLRDTLLRLVVPGVGIGIMLAAARMRNLSLSGDLGIRLPTFTQALVWSLIFSGLLIAEEVIWKAAGLPQPEPWGPQYAATVKAIRAIAMVTVAPISEELLFRGLLYNAIAKTALMRPGAVFITAIAFAALHYQYTLGELLFVLADGFFYGVARYVTGSTILTMLLHMMGNSYAAYERLR
jgi:membrane protease YdiL (CAAX protease family)